MKYDILIIGAGPAGLTFARALAGSGLSIALVEQQAESALADPADDGREIALTHRSHRLMREYGLWDRIADTDIGTLRDARVIDGDDADGLLFSHAEAGQPQLGWLVSNHAIRRAAWQAVRESGEVDIVAGARVAGVHADAGGGEVRLADGRVLRGQLLIAADSRFSESRRALGIRADLHDFGRTMLVVRMRHEAPHEATAWEWFRYGQTLALLPLDDANTSSAVLTATRAEIDALLALDEDAFGAAMSARFDRRLGAMKRVGPAVAYPLVGVYPERFHAERFACIGDAAVGMHPVTAHGFNFGLLSVESLSKRILDALAHGEPIYAEKLLADYDIEHRAATRPLYLATKLVATLYTDDRAPARAARKLALGAARMGKPFRRLVMHGLTQPGEGMPFERARKLAMRLRPR
ncbi:FAD-dependent hydroxylase [Lysobacter pythonis]|uniref:FAD-dependent hydroxylase n=1 Tax=Solilutibacter pythonis TaxID=2483112 RepID=A0A3M2I003_9GAMM|nr:5-demethoxyubiquinol-8 5-hydroxylase UbiM [Lysobacter pythonis]RMH93230.1 FAD-dependent hydroxylase [Lysobacter pythonis]